MLKNITWKDLGFLTPINGEEVVFVTRQFPLIIIVKLVTYFATILALLCLDWFLFKGTNYLYSLSIYSVAFFNMLFALVSYHNYYLSMQVVTTKRILDVDQVNLFNRQINEVALEKAQNINYVQKGFLELLFNFADVIVETAGTNNDGKTNGFIFDKVHNPRLIVDKIGDLTHRVAKSSDDGK